MILCVDIDNTVNNLTENALEMLNRRSGIKLDVSKLTAYNFFECLPRNNAEAIIELFKEKELWDSLTPLKDSVWGIQTLLNLGHRVIFATATHECNFAWKCEWMAKYFPMISTNDIIRIKDKSLIRADIMIDDCLEQLVKSPCERICLDNYWNRDSTKDYVYDIYRAHNWKEIIKYVNEIERKCMEWQNQ
jgi:5'(3')-deoxyribonucleotidase